MDAMTFHLEDFDGPLDLLLYLISKNKMDLYNIPILNLIDQYTVLIDTLKENRLEVSSEFIEMAAQLVQMKSYLLLPRSEEAERMKAELQGQLIEYSLCKKMAAKMRVMADSTFWAVRAPMAVEPDMTYRLHHDPAVLVEAWNSMMGRSVKKKAPSQEQFEPLVTAPFVSVGSRVVRVLRGLVTGRIHSLKQLFARGQSRSENVATFLAVLELIRAGRLAIGNDEKMMLLRGKRKKQEG